MLNKIKELKNLLSCYFTLGLLMFFSAHDLINGSSIRGILSALLILCFLIKLYTKVTSLFDELSTNQKNNLSIKHLIFSYFYLGFLILLSIDLLSEDRFIFGLSTLILFITFSYKTYCKVKLFNS